MPQGHCTATTILLISFKRKGIKEMITNSILALEVIELLSVYFYCFVLLNPLRKSGYIDIMGGRSASAEAFDGPVGKYRFRPTLLIPCDMIHRSDCTERGTLY